jgi:hypothetical protein
MAGSPGHSHWSAPAVLRESRKSANIRARSGFIQEFQLVYSEVGNP